MFHIKNLNYLRQHYLDQVQRFAPRLEASQPGFAQAPANFLLDYYYNDILVIMFLPLVTVIEITA